MAHPPPSSDSADDRPDEASEDPRRDPRDVLRPLSRPTWRDRADDLLAAVLDAPARAAAIVLGVVATAAVAWWLVRPPAGPPIEAQIPLAGAASTTPTASGSGPGTPGGPAAPGGTTSTSVPAEVIVQAAGAVRSPGVYRLPAGSRVDDLVVAAGGLAPDADPDRVNLAAPVADGERVWLPRKGEEAAPEVVAGTPPPTTVPGGSSGRPTEPGGTGTTTQTVVDLNAASAVELEALPGVGPATAAAILAYRDEHGRFGSVEELLEVRGIGEAKLEQIRPMATVG